MVVKIAAFETLEKACDAAAAVFPPLGLGGLIQRATSG
jgi:hypothetical protein